MRGTLAEILSDIDGLKTEHDFKHKFESVFASMGYDRYTYLGLDGAGVAESKAQNHVSNAIYLTNLPSEWVCHYVKEEFERVDPVIRDCVSQRLPIRWTETYRANSRTAGETTMMRAAWDSGLKRGLTVPIHGPDGELGIFSLNSELDDDEFHKVSDTTKYELQAIAHYFHDAAQRALRENAQIPLPVPLTQREVEILRWTAAGKTAWEIGGILNISERTVNFHIQNVMQKFGVHSKTHAAAKAMGLGFLSL
ncbi:MAG: helix-turn-helix transcriptional regulator [Candidatus Binataceae bacterium]